MEEIWKDIKGYEGLYQVSNSGRVKSLKRKNNYGRTIKEKELKQMIHQKGYLVVTLYKNGVGQRNRVHRLVAQTFIKNPKNYPQVNHKDENPRNNMIDNLEWCTNLYNSTYGHTKQKISTKVQCVETGEIFNSIREAERIKSISHITNCVNGKQKTAGGVHWKRIN